MHPCNVMGIKQFGSLDRIVKHKFDCLGLGLWLWIALGLWLRGRVGIRVYVKLFCSVAKP